MKHTLPLLLLGLCLTSWTEAYAQPNAGNAPKTQTQHDRGENNRVILLLPPIAEQLQQAKVDMQRRRIDSLRQQLAQAGFADNATQDAIVTFFKDKEAAQTKLRNQWQAMSDTTRQPTTSDAQLAVQLNDFQAASDQEKARRAIALKELIAKIGLAQKPRLQLLLMVMGVMDDDTGLFQGVNSGSMTSVPPLFDVQGDTITSKFDNLIGGPTLSTRLQTPIGPIRLDYNFGHDQIPTHFDPTPAF